MGYNPRCPGDLDRNWALILRFFPNKRQKYAMFDQLSEKLALIFKKVKGHGKLSERNIQEALREVRIALLEADVNYKVVKEFTEAVKARSLGAEVLQSLTPGQQFIKIVHQELIRTMGSESADLRLGGRKPASIVLVGLHGCGKTTTAAKLAVWLRGKNRLPYLVPADVYRPAAIEQLVSLGRQIGVPVHPSRQDQDPVEICLEARKDCLAQGRDTLIVDTAGRLHIDDDLMNELQRIRKALEPDEVLLVADAMTGQEAVNIASRFNELLDLDGVILTKTDGDARGGAALSIKAVTGKPIKFAGTGEKPDALERFHPDRMASRILGMGDVLSLIEKAEAAFDEKKALELEEKLRKDAFTLEDFREQMRQIRKMGSLDQILSMIPGFQKIKNIPGMQPNEKELVKIEAIIDSMTPLERRDHTILNGSRRKRIAKGSGTSVQDVNRLIKQYVQARTMMKRIQKMGPRGLGRLFG
jgi:signal recognition particle subunit SRP54